jgi:hypothetical protein
VGEDGLHAITKTPVPYNAIAGSFSVCESFVPTKKWDQAFHDAYCNEQNGLYGQILGLGDSNHPDYTALVQQLIDAQEAHINDLQQRGMVSLSDALYAEQDSLTPVFLPKIGVSSANKLIDYQALTSNESGIPFTNIPYMNMAEFFVEVNRGKTNADVSGRNSEKITYGLDKVGGGRLRTRYEGFAFSGLGIPVPIRVSLVDAMVNEEGSTRMSRAQKFNDLVTQNPLIRVHGVLRAHKREDNIDSLSSIFEIDVNQYSMVHDQVAAKVEHVVIADDMFGGAIEPGNAVFAEPQTENAELAPAIEGTLALDERF